jgi:hypothetical protein
MAGRRDAGIARASGTFRIGNSKVAIRNLLDYANDEIDTLIDNFTAE